MVPDEEIPEVAVGFDEFKTSRKTVEREIEK